MFAKKKCGFLFTMLLLLTSVNAGARSHRYDTGILTNVTENQIIMSGKAYTLTPSTKVIFKERDAKGAYYEHKRRLYNLRIGEKISLKVIGNKILQVEVVR